MRITEAHKIKGHHVETDETDYNQYTRYGPDCWFVTMGESDEPVYDCEEIEALFQAYIQSDNQRIHNDARRYKNLYDAKKMIDKCKEEIKWAQANIDKMNLPGNPHNYQDDDRVWLPCWLKAHKEMLDLITTASTTDAETAPRR